MEQSEKNSYQLSQWSAFYNCKCPRCRVGNVYKGSVLNFKTSKMIEVCEHCGLKYEREPGYFYVAMFVSYGLNVAEVVSVTVAAYILGLSLDFDNLTYYLILAMGISIICAPFNLRYSRLILLYWLSPGLKYEPKRSLPKT